jgi:hypothetical protein
MPQLPDAVLHGEVDILSALSSAGEFAHCHPMGLRFSLEGLYDPSRIVDIETHLTRNESEKQEYARYAVPTSLIKLHQQGMIKPMYEGCAASYISCELGKLCGLCGDVGYHGSSPGLCSQEFYDFLLPHNLSGLEVWCPLCQKCDWSITPGFDGDAAPFDHYLANFAKLSTNRHFRARVEKNAKNFTGLRFDPRRPA